jgi:hypothetical protein
MNNNNKDSIMFDVFRNQKILKSLGSYVDNLEEIKKIINLNALEHFDYAPIL